MREVDKMTGNTNLGDSIRTLRKARSLTRAELAEKVGISESHMNKIEAGSRMPGINTYQRIMEELGADFIIKNTEDSLKGKCVKKAQKILWESTDEQAIFLINILEYISKNLIYFN